tara:strand:+ start:96 stop:749 length:654 start_codon:yes stop_codon:yes gene_type:complete
MAKLKDILKENFSIVGGVVSTPALNSGDGSSLTGIVEDIYGQKTEKVSAKDVQNAIREFASYSKVLQKEENLQKIAERLSTIANNARTYTVSETEDWFDKVTVNRNMKELTNLSKQFGKIAQESNSLQQRLGGLYEDMGHILGRYYEIEGDDQHDDKVEAGLEEPRAHDIEEGDYQAFFQKAMKKFGISSPDELDDEKKKKFFNYIDANYKGKNETD